MPVNSCLQAQKRIGRTVVRYIQDTGFRRSMEFANLCEVVTVSFSFRQNGLLRVLTVPLLSLVPMPMLQIDQANLKFIANLEGRENGHLQARYGNSTGNGWGYSSETRYAGQMKINVSLRRYGITSGLGKLLDLVNNQCINSTPLDPSKLPKIDWEQRRAVGEVVMGIRDANERNMSAILSALEKNAPLERVEPEEVVEEVPEEVAIDLSALPYDIADPEDLVLLETEAMDIFSFLGSLAGKGNGKAELNSAIRKIFGSLGYGTVIDLEKDSDDAVLMFYVRRPMFLRCVAIERSDVKRKVAVIRKSPYDVLTVERSLVFSNPRLVESMLAAKLRLCTRAAYPGKFSVVELQKEVAELFLRAYTATGAQEADYYIGVVNENKLVQVMTVRRLGNEGDYELMQLATRHRYSVRNGLFSMLRFFTKISGWISPNCIIVYNELNTSSGSILDALGFKRQDNAPIPSDRFPFGAECWRL
ncbi:MAG: DUF2589 domain-containing protein [Bacteroidales bacterium]|nr:DUF2589 domain-containing protein [Bacteroidales bacterium]